MGFVLTEADSVLLTQLGALKRTVSDVVSRLQGARTGHLDIFILIIEAFRLQSPIRIQWSQNGAQGGASTGYKKAGDVSYQMVSIEFPKDKKRPEIQLT